MQILETENCLVEYYRVPLVTEVKIVPHHFIFYGGLSPKIECDNDISVQF